MQYTQSYRTEDARTTLSTEELAAGIGVKPQTLRAAICRDGHYFGLVPHKSRNRFLRWPADSIERIISGTEGK